MNIIIVKRTSILPVDAYATKWLHMCHSTGTMSRFSHKNRVFLINLKIT